MPPFPRPSWLDKLSPKQQALYENRFKIKLAALYYSSEGSIGPLSESIGFDRRTLSTTPRVAPETAIKLEGKLGRDLFPREFFRPDLFQIEE